MNTLFDLDTIPEKPPQSELDRVFPRQRWCLVGKNEGSDKLFFLWKLHINGPDEWISVDEIGRKKPHFYASWQTAHRAAKEHGAEVRQWTE